jgi:hypothetical protein
VQSTEVELGRERQKDMSSRLKEAVVGRDEGAVEQTMRSLEGRDNWSLITVIDELVPLMLMESNLRFGNFHSVKMGLFLRRLAVEGYFSRGTEWELARIVALELVRREWVSIRADGMGHRDDSRASMEQLIEELGRGNAHNAFYCALGLLGDGPAALAQTLLTLGASLIPRTLGHSLTCFLPVMEDLVGVVHPDTASALLTYVMYLSRYGVGRRVLQQRYATAARPVDCDAVLKRCASGDGIVNLHHMITLSIAMEWEHASFNEEGTVPYGVLLDWISEKQVDPERQHRVARLESAERVPDTYVEFSRQLSLEEPEASLACVLQMLERQPKRAVDWLFRWYASHYTRGNWNPHYYTSLYSALRLQMGGRIHDRIASRMALEQTLHYFVEEMTS